MDRLRILVVDDRSDAADSLAILLRVLGHDVHVAYSGLSAVEKTAETVFDVVLLDIGMPDLDGNSVARRIREGSASKSCRLIAVTGFADQAHRLRSEQAGFDDYLVKPVEPIEVIVRLRPVSGVAESCVSVNHAQNAIEVDVPGRRGINPVEPAEGKAVIIS